MCGDRQLRLGREGALLSTLYPGNPGSDQQTSKPECSLTHFQMMKFSPGTYFAFPEPTLLWTLVVFKGVGILRITLFALSLGSKLARRWIVYSTRDLVGSVTCVWSRKGRFMLDVERYLKKPQQKLHRKEA